MSVPDQYYYCYIFLLWAYLINIIIVISFYYERTWSILLLLYLFTMSVPDQYYYCYIFLLWAYLINIILETRGVQQIFMFLLIICVHDFFSELENHLCKCNCWALNNKNNYTIEELKDALNHVTKKLRKDLLIDTTVLSSTINRRISKNDDRPSSKHIGYVGITVLCVVICAIVLADLTSLPTLVLMVKATHNHRWYTREDNILISA